MCARLLGHLHAHQGSFVLPGRGQQALNGGDEDEHNEGAHQVGLEHLVSHLGVLHGDRREIKKREEEGEEVRGSRTTSFLANEDRTNPNAPNTRMHGADACDGSTTSVRERQELG